jgi:hypothetical protein
VHGQKKYDSRAYSRDQAVRDAFLKEQTEDMKNNAEFVFEGFYKRSDIYPRKDKNGKLYYPLCDIVKITKVFRGNLKPGTVEVTGVQDLNGLISPSERQSYIPVSTKYIFFCRAAGKDHPYDAIYDIYPVDNKTILSAANEYIYFRIRVPDRYMFETKIHSKGDVYRYISKLPNVKMPKITREDTVKVSNHKAIPDKPRRLTKIEKDSLKAIRIEKWRTNSIGRDWTDSIENIKK